jgi:hypothetical protein
MVMLQKSKYIHILLLIILILLISNCRKIGLSKDDELSIGVNTYYGNELRIDGYYYYTYEGRIYTYLFYRNGVYLDGEDSDSENFTDIEQSYKDGSFYNKIKDDKSQWGSFIVEDNILKFENWIRYYSCVPYRTYLEECEIQDDTTFITKNGYWLKKGKIKEEEELNAVTLHFKQFSPKPDSTNSFVP